MENNGIYIFKDADEFLKAIEEMQAQYLERHENGVANDDK